MEVEPVKRSYLVELVGLGIDSSGDINFRHDEWVGLYKIWQFDRWMSVVVESETVEVVF